MITTTACPSPEELARIGLGDCDGSCPPGMAIHIEGCPECRAFLERRVRGGQESLTSRAADLPDTDALPRIDGFVVERELGRGATGVVYLARRDRPTRHVALKLLPGGRRAGARERRQWLREAEAASQVRHPNVATLHEVVEVDDWFLLVLEYIPGGTLADRLSVPLAPRDAARLMETIARAVHHIHLCGQLHLDLKPSNILLDGNANAAWEEVTPKVSDFGIARAVDAAATETGGQGPGGTPSYMAPEQISRPRKDMTASADIHGLGAILYHMLTGRPPYQGATVLETIELVQRHEAIPPRRLNPKIPSDMETICLKCLEKDPSRRYASAKALADDIEGWVDGRPISARPVSPVEKAWRCCRRRPVVAALAAVLALTLVVGGATLIVLWRRAEADFRASIELLDDMYKLVHGSTESFPRTITPDLFVVTLKQSRERLLALCSRRPDDVTLATELANFDLLSSRQLYGAGRVEDARNILSESLARLDLLAKRHPMESGSGYLRSNILNRLAEVAEKLGNARDGIPFLSRAVDLMEEDWRHSPDVETNAHLFRHRRELAWQWYRSGGVEEAAALALATRRELDSFPSEWKQHDLCVDRFLSRVDCLLLAPAAAAETTVATSNDASANSSPLSRLASPTDKSQSSDEWARLAAEALCYNGREPTGATTRGPGRVHAAIGNLAAVAATFRRLHELAAARRIADRMLALARQTVAAHPEEVDAHLALSEAYSQHYKNASEMNDDPSEEANMKLALGAAEAGLRVDPDSELARDQVHSLRRRLAKLRAEQ